MGNRLGWSKGWLDGSWVGMVEGTKVGLATGCKLGSGEGCAVGLLLGAKVGSVLGLDVVGFWVGAPGKGVGCCELVGASVGRLDGSLPHSLIALHQNSKNPIHTHLDCISSRTHVVIGLLWFGID